MRSVCSAFESDANIACSDLITPSTALCYQKSFKAVSQNVCADHCITIISSASGWRLPLLLHFSRKIPKQYRFHIISGLLNTEKSLLSILTSADAHHEELLCPSQGDIEEASLRDRNEDAISSGEDRGVVQEGKDGLPYLTHDRDSSQTRMATKNYLYVMRSNSRASSGQLEGHQGASGPLFDGQRFDCCSFLSATGERTSRSLRNEGQEESM